MCHEESALCVTKRRSRWGYIDNPKLEQETIEGTHAPETPATNAGQPIRAITYPELETKLTDATALLHS